MEVTTNIESQELRRTQNLDIGYEEHPRAAETDDLESYFCIAHRDLGQIFTLKMFKSYWPKSVRYDYACLTKILRQNVEMLMSSYFFTSVRTVQKQVKFCSC